MGVKYGVDALKEFGTPAAYFEGVPVYASTVGELKNHAAFTLPGVGIFVHPDDLDNENLLRHEFGHVVQAKKWGNRFFYGTVVPASVASANRANNDPYFEHQHSWTEWTANLLSFLYMQEKYGMNQDYWDIKNYPILPPDYYRPGMYPPMPISDIILDND